MHAFRKSCGLNVCDETRERLLRSRRLYFNFQRDGLLRRAVLVGGAYQRKLNLCVARGVGVQVIESMNFCSSRNRARGVGLESWINKHVRIISRAALPRLSIT